jgi:hypothetical protein
VEVGDNRYVVRIRCCSTHQVAHVIRESDIEREHQDSLLTSGASSSSMSKNKAFAGPCNTAKALPSLSGLGVPSLV